MAAAVDVVVSPWTTTASGRVLGEERLQAVDGARHDGGQRLALLQDVEVMVRNDAEQFVDLVQHLAVLARDRHDAAEVRRLLQGADDRCHLDGFRPGSEDRHDAVHGLSPRKVGCGVKASGSGSAQQQQGDHEGRDADRDEDDGNQCRHALAAVGHFRVVEVRGWRPAWPALTVRFPAAASPVHAFARTAGSGSGAASGTRSVSGMSSCRRRRRKCRGAATSGGAPSAGFSNVSSSSAQ